MSANGLSEVIWQGKGKETEAEKSRTVLKFFLVLSKFAFDIDDDDAILGPGSEMANGQNFSYYIISINC